MADDIAPCPTCGRPLPSGDEAARLLAALAIRPSRATDRRDVYQGRGTPFLWNVTYAAELPDSLRGPYSMETVRRLQQEGRLIPRFPDSSAASMCFVLNAEQAQ